MIATLMHRTHVWCADPADLDDPGRYAAARALLAPDETSRLAQYHFEADRRVFLTTRALVRGVLSKYADVGPMAWRFRTNEFGRPEIAGPPAGAPLRFNVSGTRGLVVCAVARERDIGVDVEYVGRGVLLAAADIFLAPPELAALHALPAGQRHERFLTYWTLKESYVKARGLGLSLSLDRFGFVLRTDAPPGIEIDPALEDDADSWQFVRFRPTPEHVAALCARRRDGGDADTEIRWLTIGSR